MRFCSQYFLVFFCGKNFSLADYVPLSIAYIYIGRFGVNGEEMELGCSKFSLVFQQNFSMEFY